MLLMLLMLVLLMLSMLMLMLMRLLLLLLLVLMLLLMLLLMLMLLPAAAAAAAAVAAPFSFSLYHTTTSRPNSASTGRPPGDRGEAPCSGMAHMRRSTSGLYFGPLQHEAALRLTAPQR